MPESCHQKPEAGQSFLGVIIAEIESKKQKKCYFL
jgi:hypothetical protein